MKDMNKSFEQLKKRVPLARRGGKRTSKIRLLHLAIKYIKHLKFLLSFPAGQTIPPQIGKIGMCGPAPEQTMVTRLSKKPKKIVGGEVCPEENYPR